MKSCYKRDMPKTNINNHSLLTKHIHISKNIIFQNDIIKVKVYMLTHLEFTNLKFSLICK